MALTRPRYSQIYDTDYKQSVRLATTVDVGNLLISGNCISSIDGITVDANDRILVKDQTDAKQNGIYRVVTVGSGTDGTWVRAQDADNVGNGKVTSGMTTTVSEGSSNAGKTFKLITVDPIVVGTTELVFSNPFVATAAGANTAVQFNDGGTVNGDSDFTFNKYTNVLTVTGNISAGNILTSNILYPNGSPYLIGGGTVSISSSNTAPVSPTVGDFWYDTGEDILFQYIDDGTNEVWIDLSGDPAQVVVGTPNKQFYANKLQIGTAEYLLDTFPAAGNTLVAWTVSAKDNIGNNIRSSTIQSVNDGTEVYWTEYGIIQSNSSVNVVTFSSNISSGNVALYGTGSSINVSVTFQRLLLGSDTIAGYIVGGTAGPAGPTGTVEDTSGIIKTTNTSPATSSTTGALQVAGGAGIGGNLYVQSGHQFNIGADLANLTVTGNLLTVSLSPMHILSDADANNRVIIQNVNSGSNASSGITFVADNGSIENNFLDIGINNSTNDDGILYRNDGFLHVIGGNVMIGALSLSKNIHFHVGDMTTEDHMVGMFDANSFHVMKDTVSTSTTTGALRIHGGAGIQGNLYAGNITATYLYGNASQLTGLPSSYGNTQVASYLPTYSGNISAAYFSGNGSQLSSISIAAVANRVKLNGAGGTYYVGLVSDITPGNVEVAADSPLYYNTENGGTLTMTGNLTVGGNLRVNGNITYINANNITLNDSMIYLADDNPADSLDIGLVSSFTNPSYQHTGLVRDASDGVWKLFANVVAEPTTTVDFTGAIYANLRIGNLIANNIGGTITTASQTNITAVGNLTSLSSSGNISTTGYFLGNAALLTGLPSSYGNTQVASYLPTYSGVLGSSNLQVTGGGTFTGTLTIGAGGWINSGGNIIANGTIQDSKGDVRSAPQNSQIMAYTLVAADAGKHISITMGGVTVNASVFAVGDMVTIYNNSGSNQTITQGTNVTLRLAGTATTGSRTLAQYGVATLLCVTGGASPTFACSGAGLT